MTTPNLRAAHAFTSRSGGVSVGPFAGLNLDDRQDDPQAVAENRRRLVEGLGFRPEQVSLLTQVHGTEVVQALSGGQLGAPPQAADAQVTDRPGVLLAIATADCYPVLLEDPVAGVLGAAHAGWRGTVGDVVGHAVQAMCRLGARPERIRAAVGPGISVAQYVVGPEVALAFGQAGLGQFLMGQVPGEPPTGSDVPNAQHGVQHLDLGAANLFLLERAGLKPEHLWASGRCSTEASFYSYRRDAGTTGRMWAVIGYPLVSQTSGPSAERGGRA
ncbi:polyphenol oxidase family protein [Deinococcus altitudinis]|uniref:polyphenol oxidase family protein n=1 Tax=Deinococcus altitudinis TaxID=468914 RepID=UPI0038921652